MFRQIMHELEWGIAFVVLTLILFLISDAKVASNPKSDILNILDRQRKLASSHNH